MRAETPGGSATVFVSCVAADQPWAERSWAKRDYDRLALALGKRAEELRGTGRARFRGTP
ncbi:hypothetical protein [Frankia tisae]|uniref:hypothetical protein n=1 Tax=Frankia tisae TaxID=2950104 RepID=UPI0021BEF049|nr:hypothetical protein [Frankia tisae]